MTAPGCAWHCPRARGTTQIKTLLRRCCGPDLSSADNHISTESLLQHQKATCLPVLRRLTRSRPLASVSSPSELASTLCLLSITIYLFACPDRHLRLEPRADISRPLVFSSFNVLHQTGSMTSRFTELLDSDAAPSYTSHPHLNVSLEDILAKEGRNRSNSESSTRSDPSTSRSESSSPMSPAPTEKKGIRMRAFTFGNKRRPS